MAASHTRASSLRWGGVSLVASGLAMAAFWLLVIPFPTFAGAEVALDPQQLAGQAFHVLAALLAVFGYVALRDHHLPVGVGCSRWGTCCRSRGPSGSSPTASSAWS